MDIKLTKTRDRAIFEGVSAKGTSFLRVRFFVNIDNPILVVDIEHSQDLELLFRRNDLTVED